MTRPLIFVFDEKPKTGLGFEIGQPQPKCQHRPTLQSMTNPVVLNIFCATKSEESNKLTNKSLSSQVCVAVTLGSLGYT